MNIQEYISHNFYKFKLQIIKLQSQIRKLIKTTVIGLKTVIAISQNTVIAVKTTTSVFKHHIHKYNSLN